MTDLATLPTDTLLDELRARLDRGELGVDGLLSTSQTDWRACWHAMGGVIAAASNTNFADRWVEHFRLAYHRIADEQQPPVTVWAINTTFLGRAAQEDHSPKRAA